LHVGHSIVYVGWWRWCTDSWNIHCR